MPEKSNIALGWAVKVFVPLIIAMIGAMPFLLPLLQDLYHVDRSATKEEIKEISGEVLQEQIDTIKVRIDRGYEVFGEEILTVNEILESIKEKSGSKMIAVSLRIDSTGRAWYRTTNNRIFRAYWKPQFMWFTYLDTDVGREYGIFYEERVTLDQLKNRAATFHNQDSN